MSVPAIINVRDRVTDLRTQVAWLERIGFERIVLLDNDSTYPPLLEYLEQTPHEVVRLGQNLGSRALWTGTRLWCTSDPYVYTDPDVLPVDGCPDDVVEHLGELLARYPHVPKAALGLHLNDVPLTMDALPWERSLVSPDRQLEPGVFDSLSDTTFALYRPGMHFRFQALRTAWPYQVRHVPWYTTEPGPEDAYYLARAKGGDGFSSWKDALAARAQVD